MDGIIFLLDQAGRTIMQLQAELEQIKASNAMLTKALQDRRPPEPPDSTPEWAT